MNNQVVVQRARRPQGYVKTDIIAGGNDKARIKGFANHSNYCKHIIKKNGWDDSYKAFTLQPYGLAANAYINHGRWVVNCPDPECAGAEVVDPSDPVFMCLSCGNLKNKDIEGRIRLYSVRFPHNKLQIEKALLERKDPCVRNWHTEETVDKLKQENKAHGGGE